MNYLLFLTAKLLFFESDTLVSHLLRKNSRIPVAIAKSDVECVNEIDEGILSIIGTFREFLCAVRLVEHVFG